MPDRARNFTTVRYEKRERVAHVTLDRPHVLNAMNRAMHEELCQVWDDVEADDAIWLVVVSGAGGKAFSVGQDLKEAAARLQGEPSERSTFGSRGKPGWPRLTERFSFSKPLIAKVCGYALGGGLELALACDVIVADHSAIFGLPEARLGLIPGAGGVFRMVQQSATKTAMGYLLSGRRFNADQASSMGLVNEIAPEGGIDRVVQRWIDDLLRCAPLSLRAIKEAACFAAGHTLEQAFHHDYHWERIRSNSADAEEGPRAFVDKREPIWRGS